MSTGMAHMLKSMLGVDPEQIMKQVQDGAGALHAFADTVIRKMDEIGEKIIEDQAARRSRHEKIDQSLNDMISLMHQNLALSERILTVIDPSAAGEITTIPDPDLRTTCDLPFTRAEFLARDDTFAAQK